MFFLISNGEQRPSILTSNKDEQYHSKWARYCIGQANNEYQNDFLRKIQLNKNFYKGNQWIEQEDLEIFLKDESNMDRNRIKMIHNIIRPMIEQYRGNAIRMSINYRAKSISTQAINRRESKLAEALFYSKIARQPGNPFADDIKQRMPVGDTDSETFAIFDNLYVDKYVQKINYLCKYVAERNDFEAKQVRIAEELGLTGLAVMKTFEHAGHQEFKILPSENFFFDRSAKEYDLTDAGFMGDLSYMEPTEIFETYPDIKDDHKKAIENYATQYRKIALETAGSSGDKNGNPAAQQQYSGKVPVFTTYWRDGERYEYGYVLDKYGYEYFTRINYIYDGETEPRYTDKDLIKSKSARAKRILGDKLKRRQHVDVLRMAVIIPKEILASGGNVNQSAQPSIEDVVLDYGIAPYQETEVIEYASVKFPYKCYCWGYVDGEILSPVDDTISPQRLINRMISVAENQISNSRGSGTVIDKTMVDDQQDILRKMNRSEPVLINAKGRGIQNAVGSYDTTVKQGTMVIFNIIEALKKFTQDTTGINEAIKGESTGSDQLVGVTQLMIQRGSLMQEPFYNAITLIYKQCFQAICSVGKRIYADNERNLSIAVGDEGVEVITITKDMKLEDFRIFVKRENSDEVLINAGNQMLLQLFQMGLLDDKRFSGLYGRSTPDEIASALRGAAKEREELKRMQEKDNARMEQAMIEQESQAQAEQEYMMNEMEAREDVKEMDKNRNEIKKVYANALSKMAPNNPQAQQMILDNAKKFGE